jgi:hypothetical protein
MPALLLAALITASSPRALPPSRPALLVTVHQDSRDPLDGATLRAVDRLVGAVWRPYAEVTVRSESDALAIPADDLLTVVITDRLPATGEALGWIQFVDGEPTHTIYVSRGAALRLAAQGRWEGRAISDWPAKVRDRFLVRAIAVAMAHEVGHYLLRSTSHSASGLMRAHFTVADLMNASPREYRLDAPAETIVRARTRDYLLARDETPAEARP